MFKIRSPNKITIQTTTKNERERKGKKKIIWTPTKTEFSISWTSNDMHCFTCITIKFNNTAFGLLVCQSSQAYKENVQFQYSMNLSTKIACIYPYPYCCIHIHCVQCTHTINDSRESVSKQSLKKNKSPKLGLCIIFHRSKVGKRKKMNVNVMSKHQCA